MRKLRCIITALLLISLISGCNFNRSGSNKNDYQLVWSDEFESGRLPDKTKWIYDTEGNSASWGNNEAQYYTVDRKENASVQNGKLTITALKEDFGGKRYTSARLITKGQWQYG